MNLSLQSIYGLTDVSGGIHASNTALSAQLHKLTTHVSSLGQDTERPASMTRRWATRVATLAAVAALPVVPLTALTVGPLALLAFGVGRDRSQPPRSNPVLHSFDVIKSHGVLGLPEHGAARLGAYAARHDNPHLYKIAMGVAIVLGGVGQFVRVPVALTATCMLLTDGAAQLVVALGAAAFGIMAQRYHGRSLQTAP